MSHLWEAYEELWIIFHTEEGRNTAFHKTSARKNLTSGLTPWCLLRTHGQPATCPQHFNQALDNFSGMGGVQVIGFTITEQLVTFLPEVFQI